MKKTLYVDMDGVLVDFQSRIDRLTDEEKAEYAGREDDCPRIFELMNPIEGSFRPHLGKNRTHQPTNWHG